MSDSFNLDRFITAQASTYETALSEISRGSKRSHWMWYIFPQLAGLGRSANAAHYAVASIEEARAYLEHPLLGRRLVQCVAAFQDLTGTNIEEVLGPVDALKLRSSLTLFSEAGGGPLFTAALDRWYGGPDGKTIMMLAQADA